MKLHSIETTPSPHCMKLNLDELISDKSLTLSSKLETPNAPKIAHQLLNIEGVQEVFLVNNFITLTRNSHADWQLILAKAAHLIGIAQEADLGFDTSVVPSPEKSTSQPSLSATISGNSSRNFGQVEVTLQVFRGIPVQVKAVAVDGQRTQIALPERFNQALQRAIQTTQADYVAERRWEPYPPQFGTPQDVAQMVADEVSSLLDDTELARLTSTAIANEQPGTTHNLPQQVLLAELSHPDWKHRLKAVQKLEVDSETLPAVVLCLDDERSMIRRWAAAILGGSQMEEAVEPLCRIMLSDGSAIVRRTAGDALSDLGNTRAMATMSQALTDPSPLVRWRSARFLNELGDRSVIEALRQAAAHEIEFDVQIEMLAALERIEGGRETQLPMWMRIAGVGLEGGE
jgi:Virulence factor/Scaffold protein Nfu/NifU N terminal/HEAT repeats